MRRISMLVGWRGIGLLGGAAALGLLVDCSSGEPSGSGTGPAAAATIAAIGPQAQTTSLQVAQVIAQNHPRLSAVLATQREGDLRRQGELFVATAASQPGPSVQPLIARMNVRHDEMMELSGDDTDRFRIAMRPIGSYGAEGELDAGHLVFHEAHAATDVVRTSAPTTMHESIVLTSKSPGAFGWQVQLGSGLTRVVTQGYGALVFQDDAGVAHLSVALPYVVDVDGKEHKAEAEFADGVLSIRVSRMADVKLPAVLHWSVNTGTPPDGGGTGGVVFPQVKPRIMVLLDTSGSMTYQFADDTQMNGDGSTSYTDNTHTNSVFYPGTNGTNSRLYGAKAALTNAVSASGELDFGLMRYAYNPTFCQAGNLYCCPLGAACACDALYADNFGTIAGCLNSGSNQGGRITNGGLCGPVNGAGIATNGGLVLVNAAPGSAPTMLSWLDNVENFKSNGATPAAPINPELRASGSTPLAGAVRSALNNWYAPIYATSKNNPGCSGATCDPQLDCRPYVFVAMTDGADSCDSDTVNGPPAAVTPLYDKNPTNPVLTYVIGMSISGGTATVLDAMAANGHTGTARLANSQAQIQAAFGDIAASAVKYEVCNGADDNCNGAVDEGLGFYQECVLGSANCNAGRFTCTTTANCSAGFTCASIAGTKFCVPGCDTSSQPNGVGVCLKSGVKKCGVAPGGCCVDDGLAACTPLVPGAGTAEVCNGKDDNCNGQIDEGNVCAMGCQPVPEICDGIDNDCDGKIDNNLTDSGLPCNLNIGICTQGTSACVRKDGMTVAYPAVPGLAGDMPVCKGGKQPGTLDCNGCDNNCDGQVDEPSQSCYTGPAGTNGKGICHGGNQTCAAAANGSQCVQGGPELYGPCVGQQTPAVEVCNGLDDDCNGVTDDVTVPGLGKSGDPCCPSGKCGTGECLSGKLQCSGGSLQCLGGAGPTTEVCDGKDNDCNGAVDDLPGINGPCCPSGKCNLPGDPTDQCTAGTLVCVTGNPQPVCQGATGPSAEVCDGKDNDCNGKVDDLPGAGGSCCPAGVSCGTGICKAGTQQCASGMSGLQCVGAVTPTTEVCNGSDDNCNGLIDDVPGAGTACCPYKDAMGNDLCGKGICQGGIQKCKGNALACQGSVGPTLEVCDGLDNDCNGKIDDLPGLGLECCPYKDAMGKPLCVEMTDPKYKTTQCHFGTEQCVKGSASEQCVGATGPSPEICDGIDNDCNGIIDDLPGGMVGGSCCPSGKCGTGICKAGMLACGPNGLLCQGAVNPAPETCNGLDDDCNGKVDDIPGLGQECCPPGSNCGVGVCKKGMLTCDATKGLECTGATGATAEVCDGLDNDCNGVVDDVMGSGEPCCPAGSPPGKAPEACNKGICAPGAMKCVAGMTALQCVGGTAPKPEVCNGADDDCNGMVDDKIDPKNDPTIGVACDQPMPPLDHPPCAPGKTECVSGKATCSGSVKPGSEVCDGVDNNCDGMTDEGSLCGASKSCVNAMCVNACKSGEFPCPGGFNCVSGYCVPAGGAGGSGGSGGSSAGGKGGTSGVGGSNAGGTSGTGGNNAGGTSGTTGGNNAGGTSSSTGGTSSNAGGTNNTGGTSSNTGGASAHGGSSTGGATSTTGQGGAATGGTTTDNGTSNPDARIGLATGGGGCACETGGQSKAPLGYLVGVAVALVAARRRKTRDERVGGGK